MGFKIDGSVHHEAIKNEKNLKSQLEVLSIEDQLLIFNEEIKSVEHLGGTKNKADVVVITDTKTIKVSDKSKSDITKGSYDYVNTSDIFYIQKFFPNIWSMYIEGKDSKNNSYKSKMADLINLELNNLSDDNLTKFMLENVINHYLDIHVCLTDKKTSISNFFRGDELEFIKLYNSGYKFRIKNINGKKTESKQVILIKGNVEINTGLRIRICLNNGKTLWISPNKNSTGNKTSSLCIKIQQDKVSKNIPITAVKMKRTII